MFPSKATTDNHRAAQLGHTSETKVVHCIVVLLTFFYKIRLYALKREKCGTPMHFVANFGKAYLKTGSTLKIPFNWIRLANS